MMGGEDDGKLVTTLDEDLLAASLHPPSTPKVLTYSHHLGVSVDAAQLPASSLRKHSFDQSRGIFFAESSSSDNDEDYAAIAGDYQQYTSQFLDHGSTPAASGAGEESLPEFEGSGGGVGIFHVPLRAAMHPGRPPSLELRPHPLRETQTGTFLRTIACTESQLWAGQECGVRFWNFADKFSPGGGAGSAGDGDAAPFYESAHTSPTICLAVDGGNRLIWSGHKDGRIRSWKSDQSRDGGAFTEGLAWQAHRGPVLSMVITAYGDIWTGSEGGVVKVWPWESVHKSLFLPLEERHMAALLVERAYVDLRAQFTINGVCSLPCGDMKFLLLDNSRAKVGLEGSALNWRMRAITPFSFIDYFMQKINDGRPPSRRMMTQSFEVILSTIKGFEFLEFRPSEIAAAVAIFVVGEIHSVKFNNAISRLVPVDEDRV